MQNWRRNIAWLLIVLLARVLTPEAALLRLHGHQHTEDAPVVARTAKAGSQAMLSAEHQHCHIDNLYDAPFAPAGPVRLNEPVRLLAFAKYRPQAPVCRASHLLEGACLRGPPALRA